MSVQSYNVFNPYKNAQAATQELSASTIATLDDRYINRRRRV